MVDVDDLLDEVFDAYSLLRDSTAPIEMATHATAVTSTPFAEFASELAMPELDDIVEDLLRLAGPPGSSAASETINREKETLRARLLAWASTRPTHQPLPTSLRTHTTTSGVSDAFALSQLRGRRRVSVLNSTSNHSLLASSGYLSRSVYPIRDRSGSFQDDLELVCASYLEEELREIELLDHEANDDVAENKQLAALMEWKQEITDVVEPAIPLPDHHSERHDEFLEKMRHRFPVSAQKLPSSVMYTLLNSEANVACIKMVHDGEKMAVGMVDSMIRVFDVTSPLTPVDQRGPKRRRFADFIEDDSSSHPIDQDMRSYDEAGDEMELPSKSGPFKSVAFRGHTKTVTSLSFFEDDGIFLSSSLDGTIRLWSENLKANICVFKGHLYPVLDVDACPAGYYFLSGSMDRSARLWCTESFEPIRILPGHRGSVDLVKWHPGCRYFGAASSDGQFRLWDIAASKCVRLLNQTPSFNGARAMTCFRFGSEGTSIVCGYDDGKMEIVDLRKCTETMSSMKAHEGPIWSIDCSRGNGNVVATGGEDGYVKLWSLPDKTWFKTYRTRSCKILSTFWTISNLLTTAGVPRGVRS